MTATVKHPLERVGGTAPGVFWYQAIERRECDMIGAMRELAAEALFVSDLQPSQRPSAGAVEQAVAAMILRYEGSGCAAIVAAEFGDHPETAVGRMAWARDVVTPLAQVA